VYTCIAIPYAIAEFLRHMVYQGQHHLSIVIVEKAQSLFFFEKRRRHNLHGIIRRYRDDSALTMPVLFANDAIRKFYTLNPIHIHGRSGACFNILNQTFMSGFKLTC
jgi:hypothetical protein